MKNSETVSDEVLKEKFLKNINQNIGIVHRVCNTFLNPDTEEREDLFQEIMYQLWSSYPSFKGDSKFSTWMYRVAFNTAITYSKKTDKAPEKTELKEIHYNVPETDTASPKKEQMRLLYSAIHSMKEIDKVIILLYLDENSYADIADVTGLTKNNISVRLVRIKRALKAKLKNHF